MEVVRKSDHQTHGKINASTAEVFNMLDNAPINVMYCNRDYIITYINENSIETFRKLEEHLPVSIDKIVGASIDIFHKNPAKQHKLLSNEKNLPYHALIQFGPEKLDLNLSAIYDENKNYVGAMVTWDIVTEQIKQKSELARIISMVENAPINLMMADLDFNITYINPKSKETLKTLQKYIPITPDNVVGSSIDVFHKNPSHQRKIVAEDRNLPHRAQIKLGDHTLSLLISAIYDMNKKYLGPMVTWEVISDRVKLVSTLTETSGQLASAAEELSATASQLTNNAKLTSERSLTASSNAEEVSKGVEVVSRNTEEMSFSIKEIARSSSEAAEISREALTKAQSTNATITKLGDASTEIGNVVKVISSIAQQTNLLALNATIEAARAGEAGKGFAVVANEVKELAKQTAKATEDITFKINNIQVTSKESVEAIKVISNIIEKLNAIAGSIASSVEEQAAVTSEVSRVVQESKIGVTGIADTIQGVSKSAEESSTGAANTLDAARSLSVLADSLRKAIDSIQI